MNDQAKTIVDSVVLNAEISTQVRLKTLQALISILPTPEKESAREYLNTQTKTKSQTNNQLARIALDWLDQ